MFNNAARRDRLSNSQVTAHGDLLAGPHATTVGGMPACAWRTGAAPAISSLAEHAEPFNVSQVLAELADGDFLYLDPAGQITAAYPFSALPTRHRVRISGAATVFAMCAIDALGVSAMVGLPVVIDQPIRPPASRLPWKLTGPTAPGIRPASHPEITGGILGKARASQAGIGIFGQLLT